MTSCPFFFGEPEPWYSRSIYIPAEITSKEKLIGAYADAFPFPGYVSANWDAFEDALTSFESREPTLFIVHANLPELGEHDQGTYLSILADAVSASHEPNASPWLDVYFPVALRREVLARSTDDAKA